MFTITQFHHGIVVWINAKERTGIIRELRYGQLGVIDIHFDFDNVRFVEKMDRVSSLEFGARYRPSEDRNLLLTPRDPDVNDHVSYACKGMNDKLVATAWSHEELYQQAEAKLPKCNRTGCDNRVQQRTHYCTQHAYMTQEEQDYYDSQDNEDPLAGDVEPTGGYYEAQPDAFEVQRLAVMRQHGHYTETF